ncbi:VWA domain-containing protein [bacterium]|nr:VWA domain-containing protein [bacterium]
MKHGQWVLVVSCIVLATLIISSHTWAQQSGQNPTTVEILAADFSGFPEFVLDVRVRDQEGRDIADLQPNAFKVIEDGQAPQSITQLDTVKTQTGATLQRVPLSSGTEVDLFSTGATIAVVLDATNILNANAPSGVDHLEQAKTAVRHFLTTEAQAEAYPEAVTLYIPVEQPNQQLQPDVVGEWSTPNLRGEPLSNFTTDRNLLINHLNLGLQPRSGLTSLYAAVRQAILDTRAIARERGSNAVVFVVSDGADDISLEAFQGTIDLALNEGVKIIAVGIGSDSILQRSGFRLKQMAEATGGVYLQQPDEAALQEAFRTVATPVHASIHQLRYQSTLPDDGREHTLQVQVSQNGATANSEVIPITVRGVLNGPELKPQVFNNLLLIYLSLSIGTALLVALGVSSAKGFIQNRRRQSLSQAATRSEQR